MSSRRRYGPGHAEHAAHSLAAGYPGPLWVGGQFLEAKLTTETTKRRNLRETSAVGPGLPGTQGGQTRILRAYPCPRLSRRQLRRRIRDHLSAGAGARREIAAGQDSAAALGYYENEARQSVFILRGAPPRGMAV